MSTATADQPEVIDLTDPHDGRPVRPEYAERGEALMELWAREVTA